MLLKNLIKNCPKNLKEIKIFNLSSDSRTLKKKELFFALSGSKYDGKKFIKLALKKGACAVITDKTFHEKNSKIIRVKNIDKTLEHCCKKIYNLKPKNILAVTGTNGKSSVADFFHQILSLNKIPAATIGTLGIKINNKFEKTSLTSLDIISLHKNLNKLKKKNIDNVLIEASSHGLHQGRLNGITFSTAIFTNLSRDHLDYHRNMKNYFNAKMILFTKLLKKNSYIITDQDIPEYKKLTKIAKMKNLKIKTINKYKKKEVQSFDLIGTFQKKNLLMSILASERVGLNKIKILNCLKKIKFVKGRLQFVKEFPNRSKVFVDFAHTPQAIETAIKALKNHFRSNVTVVFGCGGERDIEKRGIIGKIVNSLCNKIYVTDDNPRNEDPETIRKAIIKNIEKYKLMEIPNRLKAIEESVLNSGFNEIILIAGKGHESTQDYGNKTYNVSDVEMVKNLKINKKNFHKFKNNQFFNKFLLSKITKKKIKKKFIRVSIDSKTLKKDELFVAIKGKYKDGHNFVTESLSKGASSCVISKKISHISNKRLIKTNNTKDFLISLANEKRMNTNAKIIAVTGSSGKTTFKNLLAFLLKFYGKTFHSPRSYNNLIGVPLSLSNLNLQDKFGVFEIGMSKKGEIRNLSKLVRPNIGVITNVAEAHLENFNSISGIAAAKGEIIDNIEPNGHLILNRDDKFYSYFIKKAKKRHLKVITFGQKNNADIYPLKIIKNKKLEKLQVSIFKKKLELSYRDHYLSNVLGILAVLKALNLEIDFVKGKFKNLLLSEGRGKIHKIRIKSSIFNLIDESYNANPLSMSKSITKLSNLKKNKNNKYLLLGDMLELGKRSPMLHYNLSKIINKSDIKKIFVHGKSIMHTYKYIDKNKRGNILQQKSDFNETILPLIKSNDYLLIKGSNATGLNKISKNLIRGKINAL